MVSVSPWTFCCCRSVARTADRRHVDAAAAAAPRFAEIVDGDGSACGCWMVVAEVDDLVAVVVVGIARRRPSVEFRS